MEAGAVSHRAEGCWLGEPSPHPHKLLLRLRCLSPTADLSAGPQTSESLTGNRHSTGPDGKLMCNMLPRARLKHGTTVGTFLLFLGPEPHPEVSGAGGPSTAEREVAGGHYGSGEQSKGLADTVSLLPTLFLPISGPIPHRARKLRPPEGRYCPSHSDNLGPSDNVLNTGWAGQASHCLLPPEGKGEGSPSFWKAIYYQELKNCLGSECQGDTGV